jgi:hypothetical protein
VNAKLVDGDLLDHARGVRSLPLPLIGAGSGGFAEDRVLSLIHAALALEPGDLDVTIVRYRRARAALDP